MMKILVLLIASILPAFLLWLYIWRKDPQKEPMGQLMKALMYGVGAFWFAGGIELFISGSLWNATGNLTLLDTTAMAFLGASIPEESIKLCALWWLLRRNPYFDEHVDGIVYAVCIGLGFAAMENIGYVAMEEDWITVAIARALLAVPGHYAFAVLMGYYYSVYHFIDRSWKTGVKILLVPILAHGIYDMLAMSGLASPAVGGVCAIALVVFCIRMHRIAYKKLEEQIGRE